MTSTKFIQKSLVMDSISPESLPRWAQPVEKQKQFNASRVTRTLRPYIWLLTLLGCHPTSTVTLVYTVVAIGVYGYSWYHYFTGPPLVIDIYLNKSLKLLQVAVDILSVWLFVSILRDTKKLERYLSSWDKFEAHFEKGTGRVLDCKIGLGTRILSVVMVLTSLGAHSYFGVTSIMVKSSAVIHMPRFVLLNLLYTVSDVVMYIQAAGLMQSCQRLFEGYKEAPNSKLFSYKILWLEIRELASQFHKYSSSYFISTSARTFWNVLFSSYLLISNTKANNLTSVTSWWHIYSLVSSFVTMYLACSYADDVELEMDNGFRQKLQLQCIYENDRNKKHEIIQFGQLIKASSPLTILSVFSLMKIDRSCLTTIVSTIVTYIIIIVQFNPGSSE